MLNTLNFYSVAYQLYLNKTEVENTNIIKIEVKIKDIEFDKVIQNRKLSQRKWTENGA